LSSDKNTWLLTAVLVTLAAVSMVVVVVWGLNRGFAWMAEGFYILSCENPQIYPTFSSFHFLLNKVPNLVGNEVIHYRILELATRIIGAVVLCAGFVTWIKPYATKLENKRSIVLSCFALALTGAMVVFSCFTQAISYNGLAAFFVFTAAGCIFFSIAQGVLRTKEGKRSASILLCLAGILTGLSFFAKFSSCLVLIALTVPFIMLYLDDLGWLALGQYFVGLTASFVLYFAAIEPFADWYHNFMRMVVLETDLGNHKPFQIVFDLFEPLTGHLRRTLVIAAGIPVFYFFASWLTTIKQSRYARRVAVICALSLGLLIYVLLKIRYYHMRDCYFVLMMMLLEVIMISVVLRSTPVVSVGSTSAKWRPAPMLALLAVKQWRNVLLGFLYLASLPLVASAGTNVGIWAHAGSNMAPWFLLTAALAALVGQEYGSAIFSAFLILPLTVFSFVQFCDGYLFNRFDMTTTLFDQKERVDDIPKLRGLLIDPKKKAFIEDSRRILEQHGFQKGDILLSFFDRPGLVYALGARSYGTAWFVSWPIRQRFNALMLKGLNDDHPKRLFLVVDKMNIAGSDATQHLIDALNAEHLGFPENFEPIGDLPDPEASLNSVRFFAKKPQ